MHNNVYFKTQAPLTYVNMYFENLKITDLNNEQKMRRVMRVQKK